MDIFPNTPTVRHFSPIEIKRNEIMRVDCRFTYRIGLIPLILACFLALLAGCNDDSGVNTVTDDLPAAPTGLAAVRESSMGIGLTWTDRSGNEDGFIIERKAGAAFVPVDTVTANTVAYIDSGLAPGSYHYRVAAFRGTQKSKYSNEASASLESALPAILADHTAASLDIIPGEWIDRAKLTLHIAYGHTSHGSQITTGMTGLIGFWGRTV
jgi:hypothetical protein